MIFKTVPKYMLPMELNETDFYSDLQWFIAIYIYSPFAFYMSNYVYFDK